MFLALGTFAFAAASLGPVGHGSRVGPGIEDQQLLRGSCILHARTRCQGRVCRDTQGLSSWHLPPPSATVSPESHPHSTVNEARVLPLDTGVKPCPGTAPAAPLPCPHSGGPAGAISPKSASQGSLPSLLPACGAAPDAFAPGFKAQALAMDVTRYSSSAFRQPHQLISGWLQRAITAPLRTCLQGQHPELAEPPGARHRPGTAPCAQPHLSCSWLQLLYLQH